MYLYLILLSVLIMYACSYPIIMPVYSFVVYDYDWMASYYLPILEKSIIQCRVHVYTMTVILLCNFYL